MTLDCPPPNYDVKPLYYEEYLYSPTAPNLILIHGHGSDHSTWNEILPYLKKYNIYALDLRGHGRSRGEYPLDRKGQLTELANLIESLSLDRFSILAHSMGVRLAIPLTNHFPEKVEALFIEEMGILERTPFPIEETPEIFITEHASLDTALSYLKQIGVSSKKIKSLLESNRIEKLEDGSYTFHFNPRTHNLSYNALSTNLKTLESFKELSKRKKIPVVIIQAETESSISNEELTLMKKICPRATYHLIPGSKHSVHKTHPEKVSLIIKNLID